jgi:hypothetical protein
MWLQSQQWYGQSFLCITAPNPQLNHIAHAIGVSRSLPGISGNVLQPSIPHH